MQELSDNIQKLISHRMQRSESGDPESEFSAADLQLHNQRRGIQEELQEFLKAPPDKLPIPAGRYLSSGAFSSEEKVKEALPANPDAAQEMDAAAGIKDMALLFQGVLNRVSPSASMNVEQTLRFYSNQFSQVVDAGRNGGQVGADVKKILLSLTKAVKQASVDSVESDVLDRVFKGAPLERRLFHQLAARLDQHQKLPPTYQQQNPLTEKNLGRWVQEALNSAGDRSSASSWPEVSGVMSKVEQYVLHVNQTKNDQARPPGFLQELEQMVQNSRLFSNSTGHKEMHIQLKPGSLGNMMVQVIRQDGEMIVKMMVQTQAAKEMLEGNLHHLRPMFSPQQVVVEKSETWVFPQIPSSQQSPDEHGFSDESSQKEEDMRQVNEEEEEKEEAASFQDLLMNEKVQVIP
ncbi:flagellar hook-length control protein FliK [Halobacillus litoralis]|uniref:flagellar hook-length control protein FliK n=1 Tax=Halobacillus litoralis TaxID=45668 RepID=UPI00136F9C5E|nr:hypothetical protein [Halobacillus litoralis]